MPVERLRERSLYSNGWVWNGIAQQTRSDHIATHARHENDPPNLTSLCRIHLNRELCDGTGRYITREVYHFE